MGTVNQDLAALVTALFSLGDEVLQGWGAKPQLVLVVAIVDTGDPEHPEDPRGQVSVSNAKGSEQHMEALRHMVRRAEEQGVTHAPKAELLRRAVANDQKAAPA